jgi:hypothetical protein
MTGLHVELYSAYALDTDGTPTKIESGLSHDLADDATSYVSLEVGTPPTIAVVTSAPSGWPGPLASGGAALYEFVAADGAITDWLDYRLTHGAVTGLPGADGVVQSIVAGTNVTVDDTDPANPIVSASGGGTGDPAICQFRLTLESGVPVSITDQAAKTTIYCTPYKGESIGLYNGSGWDVITSAEVSIALGTLTADKNYDVFAYNNSNVLTLEFSAAWTNNTTRADALALQDGVYCKSGTLTRRYLGTFRTVSTTTTQDTIGGTTTQVGGKRFLWNYYNRVARPLKVHDTTDSWTYSNTTTWRVANGATGPLNCVEFVQGIVEDAFDATLMQIYATSTGAGSVQSGIGLDSTTAPSLYIAAGYITTLGTQTVRRLDHAAAVGYHYLSWLERATNSGTTTWYGDIGANGAQSGLTAMIWG